MDHQGIACGEYRLIERVGSGGMGSVWRATHPSYEREVALKVMSPELAESDEYRRWFRREIRAHGRLTHPNIVRLYDLGEVGSEADDPTAGDLVEGSPFYVMEYTSIGTLRSGVVLRGWPAVAAVVRQVLWGLAYAHAGEMVHRDLKPANILCFGTDPLAVKVADFGLAFAGGQRDHDIRDQKLGPAGTVDYMAPEQIRGEWRRYGAWTDLYAVGCIAYELVCGRRPYPGESGDAIADAHVDRAVPGVEPMFEIPDGAAAWIRTLMAKEPADRYWCGADAVRALEQLTRGFEPPDPGGVVVQEGEPEEGASTVRDESAGSEEAGGSSAETTVVTGESTAFDREGTTNIDPAASPHESARMPGEAPEFPDDWRRAEGGWEGEHRPAPLGLFGLNEVPFVDREDERNILWKTLGDVVERREVRVVAITGEQGIGKTRLADWIGRRGYEVGACIRIEVRHGRSGVRGEGLRGMLEEVFGTWDLSGEEVPRQIRRTLGTWSREEDREDFGRDVRRLTRLLGPRSDEEDAPGSTLRFSALPEQFEAIERVLEAIAGRRPVCLHLDDVHRSRASAEFVDYLLEREPTFPCLVVMTLPGDVRTEVGPVADVLSAVRRHPRTRSLHLSALTREEHRELIEKMLALDEGLVDHVVERTGGMPLFAIELVKDWVDRGVLEAGAEGYRLSDQAERRLPDDLHELWRRRLEHLARRLEASHRHEAMQALEIGAMLGSRVERRQWREACREAGVAPSEAMFDRMVEQGLVVPEPDGWRFAHGMLVESLVRQADETGRASELARACAEVMEGQ